MPAKLHACSYRLCHPPPCKSPFLFIKQLQFPRVRFSSSCQPAAGSTRGHSAGAAEEWTPCLRRVSTPEGKIFQITPVSSKETMKRLKVHGVNSPPKQHHGCCAKERMEWPSVDRRAMCCQVGGDCALLCCCSWPSPSGSCLFLPSLTFVDLIISLVSECRRSAHEDRWKAIHIVS